MRAPTGDDRGTPRAWTVAAVAAAPFNTEASFTGVLTRLGAGSVRLSPKPERLLGHCVAVGRVSHDELQAIARDSWLGAAAASTLTACLFRLAQRHLRHDGSSVVLADDTATTHGERANAWRFLVCALPADLLVAALSASRGLAPPADRPDLVPAVLRETLRHDVAQLHLHLSAAMPFEFLWAHTMARIAEPPNLERPLFRNEPSLPFGSAERFEQWVLCAAVARLALARAVATHTAPRSTTTDRVLQRAIDALVHGKNPPPRAELRAAYRVHTFRRPQPDKTVRQRDPLTLLLGDGPAYAETRLATRVLRFVHDHRDLPLADDVERLFFQMTRVRCLAYVHLTQSPQDAGFDAFTQKLSRASGFRSGLDDAAQVDAAHALSSTAAGLRSLEVRDAPKASHYKIRKAVEAVGHCSVDEAGLVLHFKREWTTGSGDAETSHIPGVGAYGCRYGTYVAERRREALAIEDALRFDPELLRHLRGLDLCTREMSVPSWVVFPLLEQVRDASVKAAARSRDRSVRPLQLTLHLGEDFVHPIGALRRLHEPVEQNLFRNGDRCGHGFALGEDLERWMCRHPVVFERRDDRLFDLLWERRCYLRGDVVPIGARLAMVEAEVQRLAREVFDAAGDARVVREVFDLRDNLFDTRHLRRWNFPAGINAPDDSTMWRFLHDRGVWRRGQIVEEHRTSAEELHFMREAQRMIRRRYAARGITVEALLSSNLVIEGLRSVADHPVLNLGRPAVVPNDERLRIALSDDDPLVFATSLGDEFGYLYAALLEHGVASQDAVAWLEELRATGWAARFTQPRRARAARDVATTTRSRGAR